MTNHELAARYREALTPSWWVWLIASMFPLMIGIAYAAPFGPAFGWLAGVVAAALTIGGLLASTPRLEVADGELRAGRAHIDVKFLGPATALDQKAASRIRSRDADPRAWMVLRGWLPQAVRVELDDPADPTPYWFLSTRHPIDLAAAIEHERSKARYGRMNP